MQSHKKDFVLVTIIGALVGLLIQPILANTLPSYHLGFALRAGIFVFFTVLAPVALLVARFISKFIPGIYQFSQFAAVGTLNTFIDVGVFNLETFFYGSSVISTGLFALFKALSFVCGTTNSFVWNKYWTFKAKGEARAGEVTAFYAVAITGWILNVGVATLVKTLGPEGSKVWINLVAPLAGIAIAFLWDFFGYKHLVFKKRSE